MSDDAELATRRLRLKLALEDLREMKGFGTELVTVIILPDKISDARSLLQNEHGQAANIKSRNPLEKMYRVLLNLLFHLSLDSKLLGRESLLFTGAIIVGNNKLGKRQLSSTILLKSCFPFRYRCDSTFEISTQLEDMLSTSSYGLFVIDRLEAYGIASGKRIHVQEHLVSNIINTAKGVNQHNVLND